MGKHARAQKRRSASEGGTKKTQKQRELPVGPAYTGGTRPKSVHPRRRIGKRELAGNQDFGETEAKKYGR